MTSNQGIKPLLCGLLLAAPLDAQTSHDVTFSSGPITLAGTVYLPAGVGPHPALVVVHGSDDQTRAAYVPLAATMVRHGVATFVYDKRGTGLSNGGWRRVPFSALKDDAAAALAVLKRHPGVDSTRVGVWGGSEGGWIAPWLAAEGRVAFVIVQSAPGVVATEQHVFQVDNVMRAAGASDADRALARTYVGLQHRYSATSEGWSSYDSARLANAGTPLERLGGPVRPRDWWWAWWRTKSAVQPESIWTRVKVPVLGLWGARDVVVPVEPSVAAIQAALRAAGNSDVTLTVRASDDHNLEPTGLARASMVFQRLVRSRPGWAPVHEVMAEWAAERFVKK